MADRWFKWKQWYLSTMTTKNPMSLVYPEATSIACQNSKRNARQHSDVSCSHAPTATQQKKLFYTWYTNFPAGRKENFYLLIHVVYSGFAFCMFIMYPLLRIKFNNTSEESIRRYYRVYILVVLTLLFLDSCRSLRVIFKLQLIIAIEFTAAEP